jgi:hypothetical protein
VANTVFSLPGCPDTNSCYGNSDFSCCYRSDGTSPYDADGDGFLGCQYKCGSFMAACSPSTAPCDCNDADPNIYPGHGC